MVELTANKSLTLKLRRIYNFLSFSLAAVVALFISAMIVSKVSAGRVIQYAEDWPKNIGYERYYPVMYYAEVILITLLIFWPLFLIVMLAKRISYKSHYIVVGFIAFIIGIILAIIDPFGIMTYYGD